MKRLALNFISLLISAVQAAACFTAIIFLLQSMLDPEYLSPILAGIAVVLALIINFFMTKLDSHVRGYAYDRKMMFWISFAVGYFRVLILPFVLIGIIVSFFTGNSSFAEIGGMASDYPISCLVYAVSSLDYMTEQDKSSSNRRVTEREETRRLHEEERHRRRAEERERIKNRPHDTNKHGFCTTRFLPIGYHTTAYGGRRGVRVVSERAYIAYGDRPTVEITVSAPYDSSDAREKSSYDVAASARHWVEREFKKYYCNYTSQYNSCVPIEKVHLIIHVTR